MRAEIKRRNIIDELYGFALTETLMQLGKEIPEPTKSASDVIKLSRRTGGTAAHEEVRDFISMCEPHLPLPIQHALHEAFDNCQKLARADTHTSIAYKTAQIALNSSALVIDKLNKQGLIPLRVKTYFLAAKYVAQSDEQLTAAKALDYIDQHASEDRPAEQPVLRVF